MKIQENERKDDNGGQSKKRMAEGSVSCSAILAISSVSRCRENQPVNNRSLAAEEIRQYVINVLVDPVPSMRAAIGSDKVEVSFLRIRRIDEGIG